MSRKQRQRGVPSHDDLQAAGHRHVRLQQIIREELDALFRTEMSDPAIEGVRVVAAELSVDYRSVRVRFIVPDDAQADRAEKGLMHAGTYIRRRLVEALDLKRIPTIRFIFDRDAAASARAAAILDEERRAADAAKAAASPAPDGDPDEPQDEVDEIEEDDDEDEEADEDEEDEA